MIAIDNKIYLINKIDDEMVTFLPVLISYLSDPLNELCLINKNNEQLPLYVLIDAGGCSIDNSLIIAEILAGIKKRGIKIITIGLGQVSSGAILWLLVGDKKYALPSTHMLIHDVQVTLSQVPRAEVNATVNRVNYQESLYYTFLFNHTKLSYDELRKMGRETGVLIADQLKEYGFVDEIVSGEELFKILNGELI